MVTLKVVINSLLEKSEYKRECQPSMDGKRESYYDGMSDAYKDCANMLEKFINQPDDKTDMMVNAEEYLINSDEGGGPGCYDDMSIENAYMAGAKQEREYLIG